MHRAPALALAAFATLALAQGAAPATPAPTPWVIPPAELKGVSNPVKPAARAASAARGAALYKQHCEGCHGATGAGDGPDAIYYEPPPGKLTDRHLPDAEVFVKVSQGRGNMKGVGDTLDAARRWDLVNFVQTLK